MKNWESGHYIIAGLTILFVVACFGFGVVIHLLSQELSEIRALQAEQPTPAPPQNAPDTPTPPPEDTLTINPHSEAIKAIEADSGVFLSRVALLIMRDEGERKTSYLDSAGKVTIGVGRSLQTNGVSSVELHAIVDSVNYKHILQKARVQNGRIYIDTLPIAKQVFPNPLTDADVQLLLTDDLRRTATEARGVFPKVWGQLDGARKEAIIDVLYNLGLPHFKQFEKFIGDVKRQDWQSAGNELLKSAAARKNPSRFFRDYHVITTGDSRYFEL